MILKKPYGLLIKHFRLIHIILTALCIYISIRTYNIVSFFVDYAKNNYSVVVTDDLVSSTIGVGIYLAIIFVLISLIAIYILLKQKKKPTKMYLITIGYFIILLIGIIIASILIDSLSDALWEAAAARTYRDFSYIFYLPIYFFIILMAMRSLGFNVKQFNFKDDLKELEITDADSAEVEISLNIKTYKIERFIRRFIREFRYYVLENKIMFIVICCVIVLVVGYLFIKNYEKTKYTYKENKEFTYSSFSINVLDSMVTNVNTKGEIISEGKCYVVVKFSITNNSNKDLTLDYTNLKLYYGSDYVYPSVDLGNYFLDYGDPFMNNVIDSGETHTYIIPYEIDEKYKNKSFKIVMYKEASTKKDIFLAKNIVVKLSPEKYFDTIDVRDANINDTISFASTSLNNTKLSIKSVEITNRYEYNYDSCYNDSCRTYTDVVVSGTTYRSKKTLLVMDYTLQMDDTTTSYANINDIKAFATYFMQVSYTKDNETVISDVEYVTPTRLKDKLILQTDVNIASADSVSLLITIRNRRYTIKLV